MGMVDGCGHGGQQKYTIIIIVMFVGRDSKHTDSVFRQTQQIHCAYSSLRCLDRHLATFVSITTTTMMTMTMITQPIGLPLVHTRGVTTTYSISGIPPLPAKSLPYSMVSWVNILVDNRKSFYYPMSTQVKQSVVSS